MIKLLRHLPMLFYSARLGMLGCGTPKVNLRHLQGEVGGIKIRYQKLVIRHCEVMP
jgi:hypothetical protein